MRAASVRRPRDLGLRHQPGLLGAAVGDETLVGRPARGHLPLGLGPGPLGEVGVLAAPFGDRTLGLVAGLRHGVLGLRPRLRDQPLRLGPRLGHELLGVGGRAAAGVLGLVLGLGDDLVAAVEHVLGVVQLAGQASRTSSSSSRTSPRDTTQVAVIGRPRASSTSVTSASSDSKTRYTGHILAPQNARTADCTPPACLVPQNDRETRAATCGGAHERAARCSDSSRCRASRLTAPVSGTPHTE